MKIAITADVHIGIPGKLQDIMWGLRKIRQHCIDNNIKHIMILGDLLHDREQVRIEDLNFLVDFLIETDAKYGISVITFPGNHDMYLKNSWKINGLRPLSRYLNSYHDISTLTLDGIRFWILPFIHYESDYMAALDDIHKQHKDGDVLLTHIGVKSSTLNACFLLKSWSVVEFSESPFDRIYTGHFHIPQQVGQNVWYPGSPVPFRFDEGDCDHGFIVFDTTMRDHEFVNLWGDGDKTAPPQFVTINDSKLKNTHKADIDNNVVRIALSKEYTHNQLSEIRKTLQNLGAKDVRWMHLASKEEKEVIIAAKDAAANADELFKRFVEADKDGIKGLNATLLSKLNSTIVADGDRQYSESYIDA